MNEQTTNLLKRILQASIEDVGRTKPEDHDEKGRWAKKDGGSSSTKSYATAKDVKKALQGTDQWMKAPNGKPSKLTEKQWCEVRTKNFKDWFGDWEKNPEKASKVVDKNGEPLVVYHVTNAKFDTFDMSKARQNEDIPAAFFSDGTFDWQAMGEIVMPVFLKIINPINKPNSNGRGKEVLEKLKAAGYDGTIVDDDDSDEVEYAAFYPNQIKSATNNKGKFSNDKGCIYDKLKIYKRI